MASAKPSWLVADDWYTESEFSNIMNGYYFQRHILCIVTCENET